MFPGPSCPATGFFVCASPAPSSWSLSFSCPFFPVPSFACPAWPAVQPPARVPRSAVGSCLLFHLPCRMLRAYVSLISCTAISLSCFMDRGGNLLPSLKDGDLPYRPEQSFFGVGGGTGEEGAVITKNAPSSPGKTSRSPLPKLPAAHAPARRPQWRAARRPCPPQPCGRRCGRQPGAPPG